MSNLRERINEAMGNASLGRAPTPAQVLSEPAGVPSIAVSDLQPVASRVSPPAHYQSFGGDKFEGGFGDTKLYDIDYWTLRHRSDQLFTDNLYARGLIRRLVTNEINIGLMPDVVPIEPIIGVPEDSLNDWADMVEDRFGLYANNPLVCDYKEASTFGAIHETKRIEALVGGDVLVVLRQSRKTKLPTIDLIRGSRVRTPLLGKFKPRKGHYIKYGVEFDKRHRQVAFHVLQGDLSSVRIPAYGEKSGRKIAWLEYGTDKRLDEVRGQPLLSLVLQSLKEIDRYRDSAQRKAVINSILAMYIQKDVEKMGSLPMTGGAVRKGTVNQVGSDDEKRTYNTANYIPGLVLDELQVGEKPMAFSNNGTDAEFGNFESAILQGVAWANEIPPEVLTLAFSNNYSASQAAINEFKIYLTKRWMREGETFCSPIYREWLISEVLLRRIKAPGLLEAWRDPEQHDVYSAYTSVDWYGSIKLSTDMLKQAKGSQLTVQEGWSTNAREARNLTGTKYRKNIQQLKRENQLKAEAMRPLLELRAEFNLEEDQLADGNTNARNAIDEAIAEALENFDASDEYLEGFREVIESAQLYG